MKYRYWCKFGNFTLLFFNQPLLKICLPHTEGLEAFVEKANFPTLVASAACLHRSIGSKQRCNRPTTPGNLAFLKIICPTCSLPELTYSTICSPFKCQPSSSSYLRSFKMRAPTSSQTLIPSVNNYNSHGVLVTARS